LRSQDQCGGTDPAGSGDQDTLNTGRMDNPVYGIRFNEKTFIPHAEMKTARIENYLHWLSD
jgi:hypothetical protein